MRAIGLVLAGGNNKAMKELTSRRAVAAMPIAGSYRSIDFALSNMRAASMTISAHPSGGISDASRVDSMYSTQQ